MKVGTARLPGGADVPVLADGDSLRPLAVAAGTDLRSEFWGD